MLPPSLEGCLAQILDKAPNLKSKLIELKILGTMEENKENKENKELSNYVEALIVGQINEKLFGL
jgi:hypothetical protein